MAKSLGGIGAWAEEAEREEAERKDLEAKEAALAANRQKKKKPPTFSLSVLATGQNVGPGERSRPIPDARVFASDNRNLAPTRPAEWSEDQAQWTRSRGFDRARLPERAHRDQLSRSGNDKLTSFDEADRKPARERDFPSRADQVDDWRSTKKFVASASRENHDRRRPAFESRSSVAETNTNANNNYARELPQQQPRVRSDPFAGARPREEVLAEKRVESSVLNVFKDGKEVIIRKDKDVRPPSSSSSTSRSGRPATPDVKGSRGPDVEPQAAPRQKVNPFGDAKPREVLLEEKGLDWRKMDMELEHRSVDRIESEEEKKLKEEIRALEELIKNANVADGGKAVDRIDLRVETKQICNLQAQLTQKESELQELTLVLDDKVRFSQKLIDRPGSRSGRLDANKGSDYTARPGSGSQRLDIARGYTPERPVPFSGRVELPKEYNGGERPSFSPRDGTVSRGFDFERRGSFTGHVGMVRGYDRLDDRGLYFDRSGSRLGSGDSSGGYDINRSSYRSGRGDFAISFESGRSGLRSGINDFFQGNGSERPSSHLGHIHVTRSYNLERLDSHSRPSNIVRGNDFERPGLGPPRGDVRGYESEISGSGSWHNGARGFVSPRPGSGSWHNDTRVLESLRTRSDSGRNDGVRDFDFDRIPGRAYFLGGHDFERPGTYAHYSEAPKSYGIERPGSQSVYREFGRPYDSGRPLSRPGNMEWL